MIKTDAKLNATTDQSSPEKIRPPKGCAGVLELIKILGMSRHAFDKMRNHPGMPNPAGKYKPVKSGPRFYWRIDDVINHATTNTWNVTKPVGRKPNITSKDDDKWPVPQAEYVGENYIAFMRWDFKSPLIQSKPGIKHD